MTEVYGENTAPERSSGTFQAGRKVTNVRVGRHDDQRFDRVVFDLSAGGSPGWTIGYTGDPRRDGSGEPIEVPGGAVLEVVLTGIDWTNPGVPEYDGSPIDERWPALRSVRWDGSFEGQTHAFIGLTARLPFRVGNLDSPERVFVDIAHVRT